ncbi:hypothetical protein [Hyphobacterium marinum]|uniref:DUF1700 domain-containing protein n=1 Tax=Hyphobacterium marinum TaxID=3116574 RepID=A0ABU7LXP8_9PROT|nr:hypothetical protein [Hyphobacterium sp. Y6023]MEE2566323.1 hypothetical protein [Hyphobacterium sp. Y6023]
MSAEPEFQSREAKRIWADFSARLEWTYRDLPREERDEAIAEAQMHVLEACADAQGTGEADRLNAAIRRFGPLARRPSRWRVPAALALQYGAILAIGTLAFLTLALAAMMIAEIFNPSGVGLWVFPDGDWSLSFNRQAGGEEILGTWFIPVMMVVCAVLAGVIYGVHRLALGERNPLSAWKTGPNDAAS